MIGIGWPHLMFRGTLKIVDSIIWYGNNLFRRVYVEDSDLFCYMALGREGGRGEGGEVCGMVYLSQ